MVQWCNGEEKEGERAREGEGEKYSLCVELVPL
jgi:hypothetical protein